MSIRIGIATVAIVASALVAAHRGAEPQRRWLLAPKAAASVDQQAISKAATLATSALTVSGSSGERLPYFLTWHTRFDMTGKCNLPPSSRKRNILSADFSDSLHNFRTDDPIQFSDRFGFYYDDKAAVRLGQPVVKSSTVTPIPCFDGGTVKPWLARFAPKKLQVPSWVDGPFPKDSRAATAIWRPLTRISNSYFQLPNDDRVAGEHVIAIDIPQQLLDKDDCREKLPPGTNLKALPPPQGTPLSLDEFYWVQISQADADAKGVTGARCGEIQILVGFHLIQKITEQPAAGSSGWLWATYWWSKGDTTRPHVKAPTTSAHSGQGKTHWDNYVIDATFGSDQPMYNPYKETAGSNCATCHALAVFNLGSTNDSVPKPLSGVPAGSMGADFIFAGPSQQSH